MLSLIKWLIHHKFILLPLCVIPIEPFRVGVPGNISSIFSINSEAEASELIENIEEMFPRCW